MHSSPLADSLSNKPKNIHKHTHVATLYHIFKKSFFSLWIIQDCLEFTPWFLYVQFYNTQVCVTKLSQLLSVQFSLKVQSSRWHGYALAQKALLRCMVELLYPIVILTKFVSSVLQAFDRSMQRELWGGDGM